MILRKSGVDAVNRATQNVRGHELDSNPLDSEASAHPTENADFGRASNDRDLRKFVDAATLAADGQDRQEPVVVGTRPCLDALQKNRVEVLFVARAYAPSAGWACDACGAVTDAADVPRTCPECGRSEIRGADLKEEMLRIAESCGARIEIVEPGDLPSEMGGVGCLLRQDTPSPVRERGLSHYVVVATVLYGFWVLLSGHFTALLLGLGVASVLLVVLLLRRMDRVDEQVSWSRLSFGLARYLVWLLWTTVKASADVACRIWNPSLPISPSWTRLDTEIRTPLKKTLYANSITLTPGTLTTSAHEDHLMVHSLADVNIEELRDGEMQRRIRELEL